MWSLKHFDTFILVKDSTFSTVYGWLRLIRSILRASKFSVCKIYWNKEKKKEIWPSPMTKPPIPTENSKTKGQHTQKPPKTSITQRLRTDLGRSVGVTSNPTGVVKPVYGIPTFPLTKLSISGFTIPYDFSLIWRLFDITFELLNVFVMLRIADEGSVPEMRIWSKLIILSDIKWCMHLNRRRLLYQ